MTIDHSGHDPAAPSVDPAFIRRAIDQSNLNALRIALYQATGDTELASMGVTTYAPSGTPFLSYVVAERDVERLKAKALAYLEAQPHFMTPVPDRAEAYRLMTLYQGEAPDPATAEYGYEELGFDEFSREALWTSRPPPRVLEEFLVTVVGAGFSGIAAGIQLDRLGIPFRILERQGDIGGTWELNDYPSARVDITTFLYQYKFVKNYPWRSHFATRDELKEYIDHVVDKFGLRNRIETDTSVTAAHWDAAKARWTVSTRRSSGERETFDCNVVISAAGLFSTPNLPEIEGIETFRGAIFHTTAWDHGFDYGNKAVGLIGTGSTGSQLMPEVALQARHLTVYQRTPHWVTPIRGYRNPVSPETRWLLDTLPGYANWFCYSHHVAQMQSQNLHEIDPVWQARGGQVNEKNEQLREGLLRYVSRKVGHRPDLMAKVVPDYAPMARRLVVDNGWYDTLLRDNVTLETSGIERFTPRGIVSRDGRETCLDLVIVGAGFKVSQYLWPVAYAGRDGANLDDLWARDGARAYLTVALPGFPNFFMLYGPNAGVRAGSFHSWMEILTRYICNALVGMIERGASTIEVRREAFDAYNRDLDAAMARMLWESEKGGGGYYVNAFGRSGVQMPWTLGEFYARVKTPNLDDFLVD
ncbi:NAD(P)/FAD-dependent oxidoreductase [Novosphingobium sp. Gsoil 351]|uniref:flavin-containing monooxygenase n=1 Tax=Novosphingobium sp. Gsoil 351 TaxID=2675225 RepID=UPI0018A86733|nr:NAD(P)/FAD-dependent oxidoreductase [Novosphingobium sp. Gsoil 351]